jgi:hypothetical protein
MLARVAHKTRQSLQGVLTNKIWIQSDYLQKQLTGSKTAPSVANILPPSTSPVNSIHINSILVSSIAISSILSSIATVLHSIEASIIHLSSLWFR